MKDNQTIVYFHTGRGGRFNNQGHKTYVDTKNIGQVLASCDDKGQFTYMNPQNYFDVKKEIENKPNLSALFDRCENINDFTDFEKKTGLNLGENYYFDSNGREMISQKQVEKGTGRLNWDYDYDTDVCIYLNECDEKELKLIAGVDVDLVKEYFDDCTTLEVDWERFNGNYEGLIEDYFNSPSVDLDEFYD